MKILIASNNTHKMTEINQIFKSFGLENIQLLLLKDISEIPLDVEETEETLEGNSKLKAEAFYNQFHIPVISDDSGLEIDSLGGRPGVHSARFAGTPTNDAENRKKVLEFMKSNSLERIAQFRTVLCYKDESKLLFFEGICRGTITTEEIGTNGFGYDSIFIPDGYNKTFAEMDSVEKNSISHRSNAIKKYAMYLTKFKEA